MEEIHGVDVSWLHTPNRDRLQRNNTTPVASSSPADPTAAKSRTSTLPHQPTASQTQQQPPKKQNGTVANGAKPQNGVPTPQAKSAVAPAALSPVAASKTARRPSLLGRQSSAEKTPQTGTSTSPKNTGRKSSWLSSIGSKLTSSHGQLNPYPSKPASDVAQPAAAAVASTAGSKAKVEKSASTEEAEPFVAQPQQKGSSFFSSALRRLSTSSGTGGLKTAANGGICPRKVLNVDPNRLRCLVPELDSNKLRRVAFCVDVEIAGGPKYTDAAEEEERKKKFAEQKSREKGEGDALKHPEAVAAEESGANGTTAVPSAVNGSAESVGGADEQNQDDKKDPSRKKEKKKKSEEERKQRQENRRRKAEESGQIPLQLTRDDSSSSLSSVDVSEKQAPPPKPQARPTTDPLRMYRRCCQLRESGVLKRISEQLAKPSVCPIATPGIVNTLDLTGSRMQPADVATLGDWLAIVPVKRLIVEDSDLNDEGLRLILCGLLSAHKSNHPRPQRHRDSMGKAPVHEERSGFIQKLVLKNNPKITREGWKHISLFIYMCKSLRALDVSMVPFPPSQIPSDADAFSTNSSTPDLAEIFEKSLSERLGRATLEELVMAECNLTAYHVRRVIDGSMISGVKRLGLAGNNINDEGFEHVLRYVRCKDSHAIDLAGNDMSVDRVTALAGALRKESNLWAISLADCNLTPQSLTPLFPGLINLPNLRFLDLSHNHALFEQNPSAIQLLQQNLPALPILKRLHLVDVSMSPSQAIALAEIIPECHQLAHLNILENPQLSALAGATTEEAQEEACALYASLMVAARVSPTCVAIDIDVPSAENSEIVKALARQTVAYCLENMEYATTLNHPDKIETIDKIKHEAKVNQTEMPEILLHLLGGTEDHPETPAPDNDYIVGGTGVVKALSYMLSEKAPDQNASQELKEPTSPRGPRVEPQVVAAKAKNMSRNLLESARRIRNSLQPAMVKEAKQGDDMAYRRLLFLDNTLNNIIQRFEAEYPECRPASALGVPDTDAVSLVSSTGTAETAVSRMDDNIAGTMPTISVTDSGTVIADDEDSDTEGFKPRLRSRHNSDVSLAAKALTQEEGQIHKLGQRFSKKYRGATTAHGPRTQDEEDALPKHINVLRQKVMVMDAEELRKNVMEKGVEETLRDLGEHAEKLKEMERTEPEELEKLREMLQERMRLEEGVASQSG